MVRAGIVFGLGAVAMLYVMYVGVNVAQFVSPLRGVAVCFAMYAAHAVYCRSPEQFVTLLQGGQSLLKRSSGSRRVAFAPLPMSTPTPGAPRATGGGKVVATKRSVSGGRKKLVGARQGWRCGGCGLMLSHTFQVDHVVGLELGGSNEASNLVALCVGCHAEKTAAAHV